MAARSLVLFSFGALLLGGASAVAKNDIRGVVTAQSLSDALDTLELDGAQCVQTARDQPVTCAYDEHTKLTLYVGKSRPNPIEKLVYTFHFGGLKAMRDKLSRLYGLRRDKIEGEHKLFTGEQLSVELQDGGVGSLSIVNDRQIQKDRATEARSNASAKGTATIR